MRSSKTQIHLQKVRQLTLGQYMNLIRIIFYPGIAFIYFFFSIIGIL